MDKAGIFCRLLKVQELVFKGDDLMDQEVLFELQDEVSQLSLDVANSLNGKGKEVALDMLVDHYPYIYKRGGSVNG